MNALVQVIAPVFLVIGFGHAAARAGVFGKSAVDGLMNFAQNYAVPCLLFLAIWRIDLGADLSLPLLLSYYGGALAGFATGFAGARWLFRRPPEDAIAIGFCALFSNTVLLGLPITERAYGTGALTYNYAILSVHAVSMYSLGVTLMELVRAGSGAKGSTGQAGRPAAIARKILGALARNPLVIGIGLGFLFNIAGLPLPGAAVSALEMVARAALPAALFALGGVLARYRTEGDRLVIAWIAAASLVVHPLVTWSLGNLVFRLPVPQLRSAVVTAAMAPGVNTFLFANMYGVARRVAASGVLVATALSVLTVWVWLAILP